MAAASFDAIPKGKSKITAKCVRGERHDNFAQKKHCILVNYYLSWISVLKKLRIERGTRKGYCISIVLITMHALFQYPLKITGLF